MAGDGTPGWNSVNFCCTASLGISSAKGISCVITGSGRLTPKSGRQPIRSKKSAICQKLLRSIQLELAATQEWES